MSKMVGWAYVTPVLGSCPKPAWSPEFGDATGTTAIPTSVDPAAASAAHAAYAAALRAGEPGPQYLQYGDCTELPHAAPSAPKLSCPAGTRLKVLGAHVGTPGACAAADRTPAFASEIDGEGQFVLTAGAPAVEPCTPEGTVPIKWRAAPGAPAQPYGEASTVLVAPKLAWGSAACLPPGDATEATEVDWAFRDSQAASGPALACPPGRTLRVTAAAYGSGYGSACPLVDATAAAARVLDGRGAFRFTAAGTRPPFGLADPCPGVDKAFVGSAVCV